MSNPIDLDAVQKLCDALPWPAPWTTRSFGVDCPKADDCGDEHGCVEVESPDAEPDGQCVAQVIDCPGLETFARPVAAFIAAARTLIPQMAAEIRENRKTGCRVNEQEAVVRLVEAVAAHFHAPLDSPEELAAQREMYAALAALVGEPNG